ncbi:MAG: alpha/beta fold hydrolase [Gallionella sp.]|nr:alpha/beta fold hydrolase [Gallionella sp.]
MDTFDIQLESRYQPSELNTRFIGEQWSFGEYVLHTRKMLSEVHTRRAGVNAEKIIEGNAPFELKPATEHSSGQAKQYRRGILLVHGLTDSPYFMLHLGEFFQAQGFRVMAILLPGHGTRPGDLLGVTWREWAKAVAYGTDKLHEEADEIYLAGFSVGGALSVAHSLIDTRIRGIFLFSPALKITPRAALAHLHKLYSWLVPSAKWVDIKPDSDHYKYESLTKNAVYQTHLLIKNLNAQLKSHPLNIPVFAAASVDDVTVDSSATIQFMASAPHPNNHLVLYGNDIEKKPKNFPTEKLEWVNSAFPEKKILSSAHTAIVLPPEDPHYGAKGSYSNCHHYFPDEMEKYEMCTKHPQRMLQGEISAENLKLGTVKRLMFNPNFEALKISMQKFIGNLP